MMGWQWHQLEHMKIICILLQIDNHASTLSRRCSSRHRTNSVKAMKAEITQNQETDGKWTTSNTWKICVLCLQNKQHSLYNHYHCHVVEDVHMH